MNALSALSDITILDLSRIYCGPLSTMWLGDMGANVIKIENPNGGDDTRQWGPFKNGSSAFFANINRNKRSVTLNLKDPEGKRLFLDLVKKADVVVENFRPGVMKKLGLNYETLKLLNKRLIYASASGFGTTGPYHNRPGYDIIAQAMGGIMSLTGQEGGRPTRVGSSIADVSGGMNLVIGILAALYARERTSEGQRIEIALLDSVIALTTVENLRYYVDGKNPERQGNRYAVLCPYGEFMAKDGSFIIGCGNQKLYELLCNEVLKRPDLITDERFVDNTARCNTYPAIKPYIEQWSCNYSAQEAVQILLDAGVPSGPINNLSDIDDDAHVKERDIFKTIDQPGIGKLRVTNMPVQFSESQTSISRPAPRLGEHNTEILKELLAMDDTSIQNLKDKNII